MLKMYRNCLIWIEFNVSMQKKMTCPDFLSPLLYFQHRKYFNFYFLLLLLNFETIPVNLKIKNLWPYCMISMYCPLKHNYNSKYSCIHPAVCYNNAGLLPISTANNLIVALFNSAAITPKSSHYNAIIHNIIWLFTSLKQ